VGREKNPKSRGRKKIMGEIDMSRGIKGKTAENIKGRNRRNISREKPNKQDGSSSEISRLKGELAGSKTRTRAVKTIRKRQGSTKKQEKEGHSKGSIVRGAKPEEGKKIVQKNATGESGRAEKQATKILRAKYQPWYEGRRIAGGESRWPSHGVANIKFRNM